MLNINCTICTEIFAPTDEIVVTRCGHLFHNSCISSWLARSDTCPQCRNICSDGVHRVYFNLDAGEIATPKSIDNELINELLDGANIQVKETERNLMKADEDIRLLTQTQHEYIDTITDVNKKLEEKNVIITSFEDEVRRLTNEIELWKIKWLNFESGLQQEIEKRTDLEINRLTGLLGSDQLRNQLSTIKSELQISESNRKELSNMLLNETKLRKKSEQRLVELEKMTSTLQQNENLLKEEVSTLKSELEASVNAKTIQRYSQKEIEIKKPSEDLLAQMNPSSEREASQTSNQPKHVNHRQLLWLAREKARRAVWKIICFQDGQIVALKEHSRKVIHIATVDDISKIE